VGFEDGILKVRKSRKKRDLKVGFESGKKRGLKAGKSGKKRNLKVE
jgi:hypothetical protein